MDVDRDSLVVEEGNSTRRATPREISEATGLWKCLQPGCPDERRAAGLRLEGGTDALNASSTQEALFTTTIAAGAGLVGSHCYGNELKS